MNIIITHPGQAHQDELLAIALIMGECHKEEFEILRRDPTEEELNNPDIWVIDVGMRHEPHLKNFDHHQYKGGVSAFRLVAQCLSIDEVAEGIFNWWKVSSDIDTKGPFAVAKDLGCEPSTVFSLQSGLITGLLQVFQDNPNSLVPLLREIGKGLIEQIAQTAFRLSLLDEKARVKNFDGVDAIIHEIKDKPVLALQAWKDATAPEAGLSICPDDRGPGWTLYRFNDNPSVDFSRLDGQEGVSFAHKGGFIAKTEAMSLEEAIDLARGAIV